MGFYSILFTTLLLVGTLRAKPFSEDDLADFEIAISQDNGVLTERKLMEESKRVRDVIKEEKRRLDEKREADGKHHHITKVNPYGPEMIIRKHGASITEAIEKANQGLKDKLIFGDIHPTDRKTDTKRVVTTDATMKWPGGVVPYFFDQTFPSSFETTVRQAFATLERLTCLKFRQKASSDQDAIKIIKDGGCYSYVGKVGGFQDVSIGDGCEYEDTIIHELLHAVGFWHEQNRPDRDQFIRVRLENVVPGMEHNFNKRTTEESATYKPYDLKSIMQYGNTDFSKNGQNTMESIKNPDIELGQKIGEGKLTPEDIYEIIQAYCTASTINGGWSQWGAWSSCSVTCKAGSRTQTRQCDTPTPANGGKDCTGDNSKSEACNMGSCETVKGGAAKCSFEVDMCNWSSEVTNDGYSDSLVFERRQGSTPSYGTGPNVDATSHLPNGHYVYMETSSDFRQTASAKLESPTFPAVGGDKLRCLSYYVHMYGERMGNLKVVHVNLENNDETELRFHEGNQRQNWYYNEVSFDGSHASKIVFKGEREGDSWQSDIALDEIEVTETDCSSGFHDCDFEASTCEWRKDSSNSYFYPLELNSETTPNVDVTGPLASNHGKGYIFTDGTTNYAWENDKSSIVSPLIAQSATDNICLSFHYHMDLTEEDKSTDYMGTLSVHAKDTNGSTSEIWRNSESKGLLWIGKSLTIASKDTLELEFRFVKGSAFNGDIALDNVKVRDGAC